MWGHTGCRSIRFGMSTPLVLLIALIAAINLRLIASLVLVTAGLVRS
jgi:hypothetical protein